LNEPKIVTHNHAQTNSTRVDVPEHLASGAVVVKLQAIGKAQSTHRKYRVFVVDDSVVPRTAAKAMLAESHELRFVGDASSGTSALPLIERLMPDIVLMDVHMPLMDGPATAQKVLARFPELKIVAWTVSESSDDLLRMMQVGCAGYLLKDVGPAELERALLSAIRSESPVPRRMIPEVLRRVAFTPSSQGQSPVLLTPREMEVLRGIAKGYTTKRLAKDLGLAVTSVETHLRNTFKKLSASNRGEAVSSALKAGLITLSDL
jgi:DNA-binding NarL/FixJ family response regulator